MMPLHKIVYKKKIEECSRNKSVYLYFDLILLADFTEVLKD